MYTRYLEACLKTWKNDEWEKELEHMRFALIEEIGEIAGWYKKIYGYGRRREEVLPELKGEFGDLLYYITVYAHKNHLEEIIPYLDGVKAPYHESKTKLAVIGDMLTNAITVSQSSRHNPYLASVLERVLFGLLALIKEEGLTLDDVMESNIAKLEIRHGDSFKQSAASEEGRNRSKETEVLK